MITLEEAKKHLQVDYSDDDGYISDLIEIAQIYIDSMVGEAYKTDEKAPKLAGLLQKKIISDMYETRGTQISNNTKEDRIVSSILDKLSNYYTTE